MQRVNTAPQQIAEGFRDVHFTTVGRVVRLFERQVHIPFHAMILDLT